MTHSKNTGLVPSPHPTPADGQRQGEHRRLSPEEMKTHLDAHQAWLSSAGREGARADLAGCDLSDAELSSINLRRANLTRANLIRANLAAADLTDASLSAANLSLADLRGAKLVNADLSGAMLRGAILRNVDLETASGLSLPQLTGTDLSGARLPKAFRTAAALKQVEHLSKLAAKLFVALVLGCVYAWLTIATTTDARLITETVTSPLPIVQTPIPIVLFYWVAPFVLLALYVYFNLYMQRLWSELAALPVVFPDGRRIDAVIYPWLMNRLVAGRTPQSRQRSAVVRLESALAVILAWWLAPATLLLFWLRYLPRHHFPGALLEVGLLGIIVAFAIWFHRLAVATLLSRPTPALWPSIVAAALVLLVGLTITYGAIEGDPGDPNRPASGPSATALLRQGVPRLLPYIGSRAFADIADQDVSSKPENWFLRDDEELARVVNGAKLVGIDLRNATAMRAFLVRADLRDAKLQGAYLTGARLQGSLLIRAHLDNAYLFRTLLQRARLVEATLRGAYLGEAKLQDADLSNADLQGAILVGANLQGANLSGVELRRALLAMADLKGANLLSAQLQGADLQFATGLTQVQIDQACVDGATKLPAGLTRRAACNCSDYPAPPAITGRPKPRRTLIFKSDASVMAASAGPPGPLPYEVLLRLDASPDLSGLEFSPVAVGRFWTFTPIPEGAPAGTEVVNIPPGDGRSGYFKITFSLPESSYDIRVVGKANVDDRGRVFLNERPISPSLFCSGYPGLITQFGGASFWGVGRPGKNEVVISDANAGAGPSGAAFYVRIGYSVP